MAGSSLLALIDDIASVLDDVAMMSKMAMKKTAGVLGDDLALNAQQVSGVRVAREIPVVWAVAKGSLLNKIILVPLALLISAVIPWAITPLLMLGGAFLCYEGFEKLAHSLLPSKKEHNTPDVESAAIPSDLALYEQQKIRGAIRTDFILSAEIVVITLGTVAQVSFQQQVIVLSIIALVMTIGVYGIVAGIVKLDDLGLWMSGKSSVLVQRTGTMIVNAAPYLMKLLSVVGTLAMFMVGGGIIAHGLPWVRHIIENLVHAGSILPLVGGIVGFAGVTLLNLLFGILTGMVVLALVSGITRLLPNRAA